MEETKKNKLSQEELKKELGTDESISGNLIHKFDKRESNVIVERVHVPTMELQKDEVEELVEIHELTLEGGIAQRNFVIIEEFNEQNIDHITESGIIIPTIQHSKLDLKQDPNLRYEGGYKCKIVKVGKDVPAEYEVGAVAVTFKPSPATAIRIQGGLYNFINWQDIALVFPKGSLKKKTISKKDAEAAGYFTDGTDIKQPNRTIDNEIVQQQQLTEKLLQQSKEEKARINLKKHGLIGLDDPKLHK